MGNLQTPKIIGGGIELGRGQQSKVASEKVEFMTKGSLQELVRGYI